MSEGKSGCLLATVWIVVALLGTLVLGGIVGFAAYGSESAGMQAMQFLALPMGFLWSAAIGAIAMALFKPEKALIRHGVPFGCGCLGGLVFVVAVVVFFGAIWSSL